jgi:hypothetical protein
MREAYNVRDWVCLDVMTAQPPDPDPARTPSLEPGGGVKPGETPPDSAQTSGLSEPQPRVRRRLTPTSVVSIIAVAVFVLLFVATGVLLIVNMLV